MKDFEPFFEEFGQYRVTEGQHPAAPDFPSVGAMFFAGSSQCRFEFPNGYGASVITGVMTVGQDYELAVLDWSHDGSLIYDTPVTDDVERGDAARIIELLRAIKDLPSMEEKMKEARRSGLAADFTTEAMPPEGPPTGR